MRLSPLGDRALLVHVGATIDGATHRRVRAVYARLVAQRLPGVVDIVPAFTTVAVHYNPEEVVPTGADGAVSAYHALVSLVTAALADLRYEAAAPPRVVEIPVCYGGIYGPDIAEVARLHGLTSEQVAEMHAGGEYVVYMLGFAPGFAYLGGLPEALVTPRRAEPRTLVPAGSVGIGGTHTGVYPLALPGGWQLIGRSPLRLFDPERTPAVLLGVGDRVRFRAVDPNECVGWTPGT